MPITADDKLGNAAVRLSSGGWTSARIIIGKCRNGRGIRLLRNILQPDNYLTGPLGESTAAATANVNVWIGTLSLLPILWAFVADAFLGRYRTIVISSSLYILVILTVSFFVLLCFCVDIPGCALRALQVTLFFFSLYLVAIGQGGYKPCIKVFGADQFDGDDLQEAKAKSSFFNWLMFGICVISILSIRLVSSYIQENLSWSLGFGIPSVFKQYSAAESFSDGHILIQKFLDRAGNACDLDEIEDAKAVLKLVPIWMTCLVYTIVFAQSPTFFTKQGATMDRSISQGILIPAATLQCVTSLSIIVFIPIYDRILIPFARSFTQNPSGITMLQKIGTGISLSILAMVVAALVETKRLQTAHEDTSVLMSVWWLVPQYVLYGVADVFTMTGLQEFFYDQIPSELRSVGMALNLGIYGAGNFLSSFMISVIDKVTSQHGQTSCFTGLACYLWFAKSYVYNRPTTF
ncbi:unnamed protein product [Brassica oleracea]